MKLPNYISLLFLLISNLSLQGCQKQEKLPTAECPSEPKATLNIDRVEEVNLTSTAISKDGQSSALQPIGYKFIGKKNEIINYRINNKDTCTWLYDPDNQIVRASTLPKDGKYILQIAHATGTGTFAIEMALKPTPASSSPEPIPIPSIRLSTQKEPSDRRSIGNNNNQIKSQPTDKSSDRHTFTCDDAPAHFTCNDARNLLRQWFEVKQSLFGSKYSKSGATEFLTGKAYKKYVDGNLTDYLSKKGEYYVYTQTIRSIKNIREIDSNLVMVRAIIAEVRITYPSNVNKTLKEKNFCYEFQKIDDKWKLSRTPELILCKQK